MLITNSNKLDGSLESIKSSLVVHSWKKDVVNFEYLSNVVHAIVNCSASDTLYFCMEKQYVKPST